jgi:hypothetical protein
MVHLDKRESFYSRRQGFLNPWYKRTCGRKAILEAVILPGIQPRLSIYLFIDLFNDDAIISTYAALNDKMASE